MPVAADVNTVATGGGPEGPDGGFSTAAGEVGEFPLRRECIAMPSPSCARLTLDRGLGGLGDDGALEESDGGRGLFVYECKLAGGEG